MHVYAQILNSEGRNPSYLALAIVIDNNDVTYTWEDILKMSNFRWWGVRNKRTGWLGILGERRLTNVVTLSVLTYVVWYQLYSTEQLNSLPFRTWTNSAENNWREKKTLTWQKPQLICLQLAIKKKKKGSTLSMLSSLSSTNSAQRHAMCDKLSHYSFQQMRSSASIPRNQRNHVELAQLCYSCKNTLMLLPVTYQSFTSLNNDQIYLLSPWNFKLHTVGKWSLIFLWPSFSHLNKTTTTKKYSQHESLLWLIVIILTEKFL